MKFIIYNSLRLNDFEKKKTPHQEIIIYFKYGLKMMIKINNYFLYS